MEFERPTAGSPPRNKKEAIEDVLFQLLFELWWIIPTAIGIWLVIKDNLND